MDVASAVQRASRRIASGAIRFVECTTGIGRYNVRRSARLLDDLTIMSRRRRTSGTMPSGHATGICPGQGRQRSGWGLGCEVCPKYSFGKTYNETYQEEMRRTPADQAPAAEPPPVPAPVPAN